MSLYQHQKDLIERNPSKHGIFFDVGTGKSLTGIELAKKNGRHILVVTLKSLKDNWKNEIKKWDGDTTTRTYMVMSKEEFKRDYAKIPYYDTIIYDEAHTAAYSTNGFHKALYKYIKVHNPPFVYLLTATPILSDVMSVWGLARLLGKEINYKYFRSKFYSMVKMGYRMIPVQRKNIEEDIAEILRSIGTVVSKEEALDLPETVHTFEYFDLTKEQDAAILDLDNDPTTTMPIVYNTKGLQICGGTLKKEDGVIHIKTDKATRIKELAEQYKKLCIVCKFTEELKMLHEMIPNSVILDGGVPGDKRQSIIDQCDRGEKIMLLQADTGVGFNLTGVSLMVFYSHTYSFVAYSQCLGRIHRIGQKNKCTYIHFITKDTIEEDVWSCLESKNDFDVVLFKRNIKKC